MHSFFRQYNMNTLSFSRFQYKYTIFSENSLWIYYLLREFNIHYIFREFTLNLLSIYRIHREFTVSRIQYKYTLYILRIYFETTISRFHFECTIFSRIYCLANSIKVYAIYFANLPWIQFFIRDFTLNSLSLSLIQYKNTIFFATLKALSISRFHFEFTIFFANSL